jgi:hypothetical protein
LRIYLKEMAASFNYPLTIKRAEPPEPDFLITQPNNPAIGLEVTEATSEEYQKLLTKTEGTGGTIHLDMEPRVVLPGQSHEVDVLKDGWVGNDPEKAAAGLI